jgi:hypothetical protein
VVFWEPSRAFHTSALWPVTSCFGVRMHNRNLLVLCVLSSAVACGGRSGLEGPSLNVTVGGPTPTGGMAANNGSSATGGAVTTGGQVAIGPSLATGGTSGTGGMLSTGSTGGETSMSSQFVCGSLLCTIDEQYCSVSRSDLDDVPDMYRCDPLPEGCFNQRNHPSCDCLAGLVCSVCTCTNGEKPGEITVNYPGG